MLSSRRLRRRFVATVAALAALAAMAPGTAQALYAAHSAIVSDNPAEGTPNVLDGKVTAVLPMGGKIYVGGTFTTVKQDGAGQPQLVRHGLFSFDPATGAIDPGFA